VSCLSVSLYRFFSRSYFLLFLVSITKRFSLLAPLFSSAFDFSPFPAQTERRNAEENRKGKKHNFIWPAVQNSENNLTTYLKICHMKKVKTWSGSRKKKGLVPLQERRLSGKSK